MPKVTRREFFRMAGGAAIAASLGRYQPPVRPAAFQAPAGAPNILLFTIDTLRGDSIGLNGSPIVKTPNLDRLGHGGTWFTNAIIQQPNTNASHTSIFTGVFPFVHGVRQHMIDLLSPGVSTLAEILDLRGYATAGLYSWVSLEPGFSGLRGFDTYEDLSVHLVPIMRDPRFQNLIVTYRLLGKYLFLPDLIENGLLTSAQDSVEDNTVGIANVTTDAVLRWLDANADSGKPFFLWVHYYDPHYPYQPPPPFDTMYDPNYTGTIDASMKTVHYIYANSTGNLTDADVNHIHSLYNGAISFADQQLGRVLDKLDDLGVASNTITLVTGDHGESLGPLGRWFHGPRTNYTDIHVPLIIRYPGVIPVNRSIDAIVESIDIMPTILDLLKIPVPPIVQGKSLMPLINGQTTQVRPGATAMLDTFNEISYVAPDWHLIWYRNNNTFALYDYHDDPLEVQDLSYQRSGIVNQLQGQLLQQLAELKFTGK